MGADQGVGGKSAFDPLRTSADRPSPWPPRTLFWERWVGRGRRENYQRTLRGWDRRSRLTPGAEITQKRTIRSGRLLIFVNEPHLRKYDLEPGVVKRNRPKSLGRKRIRPSFRTVTSENFHEIPRTRLGDVFLMIVASISVGINFLFEMHYAAKAQNRASSTSRWRDFIAEQQITFLIHQVRRFIHRSNQWKRLWRRLAFHP